MTDFLEVERRHCFDYFYQNFSRNENFFGMMPDRVPDIKHGCSVAANGYFLSAMVVGADFGYIDKTEAQEICRKALENYLTLESDKGFFYHFYNHDSKNRKGRSELSPIDTALLLVGALTAGSYFGGKVSELSKQLANRCDWTYFYDKERKQFYMARFDKGFSGYWDCYSEQLIMYFLAAAYGRGKEIAKEAYCNFARLKGSYGSHKFIHGWFGSLFIHQFSHAYLDLRNVKDRFGVNWFENSVEATLANRQFCIDNSKKFQTYGENSWGITSCETSKGYFGNIGAPPSGNNNAEHRAEGTVPPCGALGSIVFTPKESLAALKHYYSIPSLVGKYGLTDAYNLDDNWFAQDYISIDKGITLLMAANYEKQTIWNSFCSLEEIKRAYEILEFKEDGNGKHIAQKHL